MVTVLVPTGTPFSADRRSEAERHHFGHKNNGGRGNVTAAESPSRPILPPRRSCSARVGSAVVAGRGRNAAPDSKPKRERFAPPHRSGRARTPGAPPRWGRTPSEPKSTRGSDNRGEPGGSRHPLRRSGNGRLGHGLPTRS